ncbi:unnamed protein product [Arctia plantaginis]|uniref:FP protein C-terminal domain-containing protein n=1 Tax=Arctia plantaginis TaxID=874455 RepID=A0A8S1B8K5_ARCPL|nr:unnamed protein product [Arctia plantaginis]
MRPEIQQGANISAEPWRLEIREIIREELRNALHDTVRSLTANVKEINDQIRDFRESMSFINSEFEKLKNDNTMYKKEMDQMRKENGILRSDLEETRLKYSQLDQMLRANNVEIQCVPESKLEKVMDVVKQLGRTVNIVLHDSDIQYCSRVAKVKPDSTRPRSILARFSSPRIRDNFLAAVSAYNKKHIQDKLNTHDLGFTSNGKSPVFVVENLSPENKSLHAATRIRAKDLKYKFIWVRGGRIYVRKSETAEKSRDIVCTGAEILHVTLSSLNTVTGNDLSLILVYIPPDASSIPLLLDLISQIVDNILAPHVNHDCIVMGDFNLPCLTWTEEGYSVLNNCPQPMRIAATTFVDNISVLGFAQYNLITNSKGRMLDLCFSTTPLRISKSGDPLLREDRYHPSLVLTATDLFSTPLVDVHTPRPNYHRGDYVELNKYFNKIDWDVALAAESVDDAVEAFYKRIQSGVERFVPLKNKAKSQNYPVCIVKIGHFCSGPRGVRTGASLCRVSPTDQLDDDVPTEDPNKLLVEVQATANEDNEEVRLLEPDEDVRVSGEAV